MQKNNSFNLWLLTALGLGTICGLFSFELTSKLSSIIIELFINTLKLISLPIIFLAILSTVTKMNNLKEAAFLGKKILTYTTLTTLIAASVALLLFYFINPIAPTRGIHETPLLTNIINTNYVQFLLNIIPSNPVQAALDNNVLGVTFMAAILSIAILKIPGEQGQVVKSFFQGLFAALLKISSW
ncbi:MAG: cation:dicarboxylase symporter family transporter, partial [Simkaniaceae bacterium]|nr:cation:dicarboxylase symporter family transporter [Simkaniaceae bacterium]